MLWSSVTHELVPRDVRIVEVDGWSPRVAWPVGLRDVVFIEMRTVAQINDLIFWMGYDKDVNILLVGWRDYSDE